MQWFSAVKVKLAPKMNSVPGDKNFCLAGHRYQSLLLQFLHPTIRDDLCAGKIYRVSKFDLRLRMYDYNFILKLLDLLRHRIVPAFYRSRSLMRILGEETCACLRKLSTKSNEVLTFDAEFFTPAWPYCYWAEFLEVISTSKYWDSVPICKLSLDDLVNPDSTFDPVDVCLISLPPATKVTNTAPAVGVQDKKSVKTPENITSNSKMDVCKENKYSGNISSAAKNSNFNAALFSTVHNMKLKSESKDGETRLISAKNIPHKDFDVVLATTLACCFRQENLANSPSPSKEKLKKVHKCAQSSAISSCSQVVSKLSQKCSSGSHRDFCNPKPPSLGNCVMTSSQMPRKAVRKLMCMATQCLPTRHVVTAKM